MRDGVEVLAGKFEGDRWHVVLQNFCVCFGSTGSSAAPVFDPAIKLLSLDR